MNKKIESLIEGYKQTIEYLQKECMEKTNCIINLCKKLNEYNVRVKEFKKENEKYKSFLEWMLKQQYYILPANIKKKIKEVLNDNNINLN